MEVSTPIFQLGFKADPAENGPEHLRLQLLGTLACEALLGNSSPLYAKLYRLGLINKNFGYGVEYYPGCALLGAERAGPPPRSGKRSWTRRRASPGRAWTSPCSTA